MSTDQSHEIIGIGSPFIDHIIEVSEELLTQIPGAKGGMVAVDYQTLIQLLADMGGHQPALILGGSGANTIKGLANLGHRCALIGRIGRDVMGKRFLEHLEEIGVTSFLQHSDTPTAQVVCLVTPDRERTMRSFLGASQEMTGKDLDPAVFKGARLVHIEGYSLFKESLTQRAMELAKEAGAKISFDLGSFEVVQAFQSTIIELLARYVDIVFANVDETRQLTRLDPEKGCGVLSDLCSTAVILAGKEGCWIGNRNRQIKVPAFPVEPIDSTGAGDLFASGFLHGYLQGRSLEECARYGALAGAAVVQVFGVNLTPEHWQQLKTKMG